MKFKFSFTARLLVGLSLLILLLSRANLLASVRLYYSSNYLFVSSAFVLLFLGEFTRIYRIQLLLKLKHLFFPSTVQIKTYFMSTFFGSFMPSSLGSDVARFWFFKREKSEISNLTLVSILLVDRFIGLIGLLILFAVGFVLDYSLVLSLIINITGTPESVWFFVGFLAGAIVVIIFRRPIWKRFVDLWTELDSLFRQRVTVFVSLVLSVLYQIGIALTVYLIYLGVASQPTLPATVFLVFVPIVNLVTILPFSVAGIGIREWAFIFLFSPLGVSNEELVAVSLGLFFFILVQSALGGLVFLFNGKTGGSSPTLTLTNGPR